MKPSSIPESLRQKLAKGGRIRAAQMTKEERQSNGRKAWATRLAKARADEREWRRVERDIAKVK
jgi:hypothetical protein